MRGKTCGQCTWRRAIHKGDSCEELGFTPEDEACEKFRDKETDLVSLDNLVRKVKSKMRHNDWLPKDPTAAFIVCVAQGPWKWERRDKITKAALKETKGKDMSQIAVVSEFPFDWQKGLVSKLNAYLVKNKKTMPVLMAEIKALAKTDSGRARQTFYDACGAPQGPKVLSLFLRDWLRIATFPIDRWVGRALKSAKLPQHEAALVALCEDRGYDPVAVAVGTVRHASNGAIG